jgi:hypothetical protein
LVVPEAALSVPQEAPVAVNMTRSPATGEVTPVVTVNVTTCVDVPSAGFEAVAGLPTTALLCAGTVVWARVPLPLPPVAASVAVIVQKPTVLDAVYVTEAWPAPPAVGAVDELSVPQAAAGLPLVVKVTTSPFATGANGVIPELTVAVTVRVEAPSAGTPLDAVNVTATVLRTWVCVIVTVPVRAPLASVAVIVQVPAAVDELYVIVASPVAPVAIGLVPVSVPQVVPPLVVKFTKSPTAGFPLACVTCAVTVE